MSDMVFFTRTFFILHEWSSSTASICSSQRVTRTLLVRSQKYPSCSVQVSSLFVFVERTFPNLHILPTTLTIVLTIVLSATSARSDTARSSPEMGWKSNSQVLTFLGACFTMKSDTSENRLRLLRLYPVFWCQQLGRTVSYSISVNYTFHTTSRPHLCDYNIMMYMHFK